MGSCGHNHDCGAHGHGESGDDGEEWSLFNEVDTERCFALNEAVPGSLKGVLKPWTERLQTEPVLRSDSDEQLLICIPFCTAVKLKAICLIGSGGQENPKTMKAFLNVESMDFSSAESTTPIQTWDLIDDNQNGTIEYRTKYTKFQNVQNLWLFITENFGAETTSIQYIGFKGIATNNKRQIIKAVYELRPQPADHRTKSHNFNPSIL